MDFKEGMMKIESGTIWKRKSDNRIFMVLGVASAPGGEYVSIQEQNNNPGTSQTEGNINKDQFIKEYEIQE